MKRRERVAGTGRCPAAAGGGASGKKPRFLPEARWAGQDARIQRFILEAHADPEAHHRVPLQDVRLVAQLRLLGGDVGLRLVTEG